MLVRGAYSTQAKRPGVIYVDASKLQSKSSGATLDSGTSHIKTSWIKPKTILDERVLPVVRHRTLRATAARREVERLLVEDPLHLGLGQGDGARVLALDG